MPQMGQTTKWPEKYDKIVKFQLFVAMQQKSH